MTLAYWCVLISGLLPYVFAGIAKWDREFDNARPRLYLGALHGYRQRANWVQQNAFEMFPFFAAAVLIAHQVGAPQARVDLWAALHVVLRVGYGAAYLADWATTRSVIWLAALGCIVALFFA